MRALIIDDQRDFYESIRPILKKSGFRLEYSADLESSRTMFSQRVFDMVLTDLQMPPGNWGGLDVIRMIREHDPVIPLFVISGKGTLAECIQALRLGADDYIRKEMFSSEFVERVMPRFARPYVIEHAPSLISYLFRLFEEEQQEYTKARRLIDVYENVVRLLSLITIAEQCPKEGVTTTTLLKTLDLARPSLGSYIAFLFGAINGEWDGKLLTALRDSDVKILREDCDRITKCRNVDFGHSAVLPPHRAVEIIETLSPLLVRFLNAISFIRRFRMFAAESLRYDGLLFAASGKLLRGSNLHHPIATLTLDAAVPTKHTVVILDSTVIADLGHLIGLVPAQKGDWDVYRIYSKIAKSGFDFDFIPK